MICTWSHENHPISKTKFLKIHTSQNRRGRLAHQNQNTKSSSTSSKLRRAVPDAARPRVVEGVLAAYGRPLTSSATPLSLGTLQRATSLKDFREIPFFLRGSCVFRSDAGDAASFRCVQFQMPLCVIYISRIDVLL